MTEKSALLIIDVQNDFLPGGALAVPKGDEIIPIVNQLMAHFDIIVATQDFHPADHGSFAANHEGKKPGEFIDLNGLQQILWPVHCVQGTEGAALNSTLKTEKITKIFTKGEHKDVDSYSGFFDNGRKHKTALDDYLKTIEINKVYIVGLATDYCVKYTALDAKSLGYETVVIKDATKAVNLSPDDFDKAIEAMKGAGIDVISSLSLIK